MTLIRYTPSNLPASAMRALAPHWGALLGLALFLVAGLAVLDDYGVQPDEFGNALRAERNYAFLIGKDDEFASAEFYVRLYGPSFDMALLFVERAFGLENLRATHLSRHLVLRLFFLSGGVFAYLLALRMLGSRLLALAAMLLFLLHPRLYGHSFFNSRDIPFLVMFVVTLYLTHRALKRDTLPSFVLLGVGVGLLANLRIIGVILLAAVPALRALDLAFAQGWAERKRVLLTAGGFALASALTVYALLPYLWPEPVGRAVEWWTILSNHPVSLLEFFRGTLYWSRAFPPEYLPVWISITAPPFALLLGGVGAGAILVAAARAPRKALRNGSLRFGLLLVGCFALPVFAVMLPGGNIYNGWRQMYFLWAPFTLLGAFGLQWLAAALGRRRPQAAVYGAALAGAAAMIVSMALLHPHQHIYFNLFADRVTPEHLRWQYSMDYWWISPWFARKHLANSFSLDVVRNAPSESWLRSATESHRVKVYANTLLIVEQRDDLRKVYEAVRGREPLIDGAFDVHRIDGALALAMEPCAPAFVYRSSVFLRAFPVDADDLNPAWREGEIFEESRNFPLRRYGAYFDGKCVASLPLPAYPIADFELRWTPELLADGEARAKARRAREEGRLLARAAHRSGYDVYLADGELVYLNDSCDPPETEHTFHLNAHPERIDDLPEERRERGFERLFFYFRRNGAFVDGGCAAFFPLPDYSVAAVKTGQNDAEGANLWSSKFWIDPKRRLGEATASVSGEPVARGGFDVHLADGALVYAKEPCGQGDADARFFLHIVPERAEDLPEERREYGFDNLDFAFFPNGALFEGSCAARIPLPDYPVAGVRTGQRDGEGGVLWSAEFVVDPGRRWADAMAGVSGEPVARGAFDVHLADGALVYVKEPCEEADTDARFFLHIVPDRAEDLPEERREYGFDTRGFAFFSKGALFEGSCAARAALPDYPVSSVRTGQYVSGEGEIWSAEFAVGR